jgi:hypothetical protein
MKIEKANKAKIENMPTLFYQKYDDLFIKIVEKNYVTFMDKSGKIHKTKIHYVKFWDEFYFTYGGLSIAFDDCKSVIDCSHMGNYYRMNIL